ncbi:hypothetical protein GC102_21860 [Paenibacillus sp. LMG 31460]|uniref:Uncharacterized protein n=1 Tax=Paenibacillus germinis TaxID=2654979 RepID=A0ABX1Z4S1_9BACL|nr:hypothetical protein [Paenibacillus germinis]
MIWLEIFGITIFVLLPAYFLLFKIKQNQKKENVAFVVLTVLGWILAILLVLYPNLPGPTQVINKIYEPLGKLYE